VTRRHGPYYGWALRALEHPPKRRTLREYLLDMRGNEYFWRNLFWLIAVALVGVSLVVTR